MLLTRVLTAIVALPLTVAIIIYLPTWGVAGFVSLLMLLGAWEWAGLMRLTTAARGLFVVAVAICLALIGAVRTQTGLAAPDQIFVGLACLFWLVAIGLVARYPVYWAATLGRRLLAGLTGCVVLSAPVAAVAYIHQADGGPFLILWLCVIVWAADTGAYAAGRTLGRHKLCPRVSPGKTIEGAVGGMLLAMVVAGVGAFLLGGTPGRILGFIILGAWIATISIVGDLTISMFKRSAGVKDSGHLFPGHGGVLDRMDSMTAAAPWFVVGLLLIR